MSDAAPRALVPLDRVVESLGGAAAQVRLPPGVVGVGVSGARIHDPLDPGAVSPGEVVLAVNLAPAELPEVVSCAAAHAASVVAVRGEAEESVVQQAAAAGLVLLCLSTDVSWDEVFRVIQNLASSTAATDDVDAPVRDLFSLANALAALVGGAITIEDARFTLLAHSTLDQPIDEARRRTILGRGHGEGWAERLREVGVLRPLVAEPGTVVPVVDPLGEARPRLAGSVGAGSELLGFVWAVEGDRPFTTEDEVALRGSLPLVATHILRHRASGDPSRRRRGAALRDALLADAVPASLADDLGLPADSPYAVVAFRLLVDDPVEQAVTRTKTADLVTTAAEAYRRRVVCAWVDATVYALFPGDAALVPLARGIAEQAGTALPAVVLAGVGSSVPRLADLHVSRDEADRVVRVLAEQGVQEPRAAHLDAVRTEVTLLALRDLAAGRSELRLPEIDVLERADAEHGTHYCATLRAFACSGGSIPETARALSLHPNSVRYRLARIGELVDLDLTSADVLFVVALHFRVSG